MDFEDIIYYNDSYKEINVEIYVYRQKALHKVCKLSNYFFHKLHLQGLRCDIFQSTSEHLYYDRNRK